MKTSDATVARAPFIARWRRAVAAAFVCLSVTATPVFSVVAAGAEMKEDQTASAATILHQLKCFRQMGSVLYVAAHPDDENTELLAYFSRGRDYRTAYLSLTRGDGGQNILGPDLGEKLGVARTQELLAARHIDGAQQYFSRAIDFGFSKNYEETLNVWNKQEILSDVVRVIRRFRPDVIITRFSPSPGGTHGHHTASTVLAMEAFKLAGDPKAFPEQNLPPWQPKRIFWNISIFQKDKAVGVTAFKMETNGKDSITGNSFTELARQSRAMHKTQGFDNFQFPTRPGNDPGRTESFQLLDGPPPVNDIMDGVDTTWNRVQGGSAIAKSIDDIIATFDAKDVAASVPGLLKLREQLAGLKVADDPVLVYKKEELDRILQACLGLRVETTTNQRNVVPGEQLKLRHTAAITANLPSNIAVHWTAVRYPLLAKDEKVASDAQLNGKRTSAWDSTEALPAKMPLTQPWWLRSEGTPGLVHADDPSLIGTAENSPSFPIENVFEIQGQKLVIVDQPVQITTDSTGKESRRRLDVIPPVSLRFVTDVTLMTPGASKSVEVEVTPNRADAAGALKLETPSGWTTQPVKHSFNLTKVGQHDRFKFTITAPNQAGSVKFTACAEIHGARYCNQLLEVNYPHIPPQLLQPRAVLKAVSVDLATRGHAIGYLPGAGDTLVQNMEEMGYTVKVLDDANLTSDDLLGLDAVVLGVRAFNVREHIGKAMPTILEYIKNGGTVIVQYNRPDKLKAEKIAPYDLKISPDRVTNEKAPVTFLAPDSPVLNTPNKITTQDFDGWVQERGIYFANQWDEHFTPILAFNDPGEPVTKGSLLIAPYGKGYYIYTGLVFFRQLPAGVPGAYRLFANLLSINK